MRQKLTINPIGIVRSLVDRAVNSLDDLIAGDGGARKSLNPEQQRQFDEWHNKTRPELIAKGIDVSRGETIG
jgi:hypothetical protein